LREQVGGEVQVIEQEYLQDKNQTVNNNFSHQRGLKVQSEI
jgi:hypothetical protein